jgi:hypothetical protein
MLSLCARFETTRSSAFSAHFLSMVFYNILLVYLVNVYYFLLIFSGLAWVACADAARAGQSWLSLIRLLSSVRWHAAPPISPRRHVGPPWRCETPAPVCSRWGTLEWRRNEGRPAPLGASRFSRAVRLAGAFRPPWLRVDGSTCIATESVTQGVSSILWLGGALPRARFCRGSIRSYKSKPEGPSAAASCPSLSSNQCAWSPQRQRLLQPQPLPLPLPLPLPHRLGVLQVLQCCAGSLQWESDALRLAWAWPHEEPRQSRLCPASEGI